MDCVLSAFRTSGVFCSGDAVRSLRFVLMGLTGACVVLLVLCQWRIAVKVGDFCNRDVIVIGKDESVVDAAKLMRKHHVGSVIVVGSGEDECTPLGVLTDRDIVIEFVADNVSPSDIAVGDAMSYELVTIEEDAGLIETISLMRDQAIRRIPVVDSEGALVGVVASDDALELLAEQLSDLVAVVDHQWREEFSRRA